MVNKTDGLEEHSAMADFWTLGLGDPWPIAAAHGRNVSLLIDTVLEPFPERDASIGRHGNQRYSYRGHRPPERGVNPRWSIAC